MFIGRGGIAADPGSNDGVPAPSAAAQTAKPTATDAKKLAKADAKKPDAADAKQPAATIEMFDGMKSGDLDVKIIPHNASHAQLVIKNNTQQPMNVHLPDAFAAVPVLAQQQGVGSRTTTSGSGSNNNKNQGTGSSGSQRQSGGAFNVAAEQVVKIKVPLLCLDYSKAEPNARVPYEVRPIDSYTSVPEIQDLCKLLGEGKLDHQAAQAAAWHLANQMSWDQLKNLRKYPHLPAFYAQKYFTPTQISEAMKITDQAMKMAEARTKAAPPAQKSAASTNSVGLN